MGKSGKDSLLGNKIAAGVLTAGLILWGANRIAHIFIPDEGPEKPAIQLAGLAPAAPVSATSAGPESIIPLLAGADAAKGQAFVQQQCAACHTLTQGGANGVGPNLYGILGGPMFAHAGFSYSDAAKAKAKGNWDYDSMNAWLTSPSSFASGTDMSYAGIRNPQTRADVLAYLRSLASSPLPIPAAPSASAAPAQAAAPAAPGIDALFASADTTKGQAVFQQQCGVCHSIAKGGPNGVGPNLYGIVGAKAFSAPGFTYSSAVQAKAGQPWTPDSLSDWLKAPNSYASGTAMSFAGIKNDQIRADVIAYLNKNADSPAKLP
ncbi:MAG: cytochrome c family protein [Acidocella sp.]|nr:cytochrome c family protein [Acidocella sp.]